MPSPVSEPDRELLLLLEHDTGDSEEVLWRTVAGGRALRFQESKLHEAKNHIGHKLPTAEQDNMDESLHPAPELLTLGHVYPGT